MPTIFDTRTDAQKRGFGIREGLDVAESISQIKARQQSALVNQRIAEILSNQQLGAPSGQPVQGQAPQSGIGFPQVNIPQGSPYLEALNVPGLGNIRFPEPAAEVQRQIMIEQAKQIAKERIPDRETITAVGEGLNRLNQVRELLKVDAKSGRLGTREGVSPSALPGVTLTKDDQRKFRTLIGKVYNDIALLRTGKQGLERSIPIVRREYSIGETDSDDVIIFRLQQMENELMSYATGQSSSNQNPFTGETPSGSFVPGQTINLGGKNFEIIGVEQ